MSIALEIATSSKSSMIDPAFSYGETEHCQYEQQGYFTFDRLLTPEALAACQANIERMLKQAPLGVQADNIISAHMQDRWIWNLATQPPILDLVERQVGPHIILWASALLCKPPGAGRTIAWHQDTPYWNITGTLAAGLWIPFDDVDADNGAMCVLPGWHLKGELPRKKAVDSLFTEEIEPSALPADIDAVKYQYRIKAGGLAIHHTMMPHNSLPNRSSRWRRVLVLRYASAAGTVGPKEYEDYRTGKMFSREAFLVRGEDIAHCRYRTSPFE